MSRSNAAPTSSTRNRRVTAEGRPNASPIEPEVQPGEAEPDVTGGSLWLPEAERLSTPGAKPSMSAATTIAVAMSACIAPATLSPVACIAQHEGAR